MLLKHSYKPHHHIHHRWHSLNSNIRVNQKGVSIQSWKEGPNFVRTQTLVMSTHKCMNVYMRLSVLLTQLFLCLCVNAKVLCVAVVVYFYITIMIYSQKSMMIKFLRRGPAGMRLCLFEFPSSSSSLFLFPLLFTNAFVPNSHIRSSHQR